MKKFLTAFAAVVVISLAGVAPGSNEAAAQGAKPDCAPGNTRCVHFNNDADGSGTDVRSFDTFVGICDFGFDFGVYPTQNLRDLFGNFTFENEGECVSFLKLFFL